MKNGLFVAYRVSYFKQRITNTEQFALKLYRPYLKINVQYEYMTRNLIIFCIKDGEVGDLVQETVS